MKTNVTIKFETKEEVLTAIDKLVELGYINDADWNNDILFDDEFWILNYPYFIHIYSDSKINIYNFSGGQPHYERAMDNLCTNIFFRKWRRNTKR